MSSHLGEETTFGATIIPTTPSKNMAGLQTPIIESPALTPVVTRDGAAYSHDDLPKATSPQSPFYQHPPASFERVHSRESSKNNVKPFEKDLEAGHLTPLSSKGEDNPFASKISLERNKECKMWPSRQTLMEAKRVEKQRKRQRKGLTGCAPVREKWSNLNKRQRLIFKIVTALILVGVIVAIAVGITAAVGGFVYSSDGGHQVGDGHS